MQIGQNYLSRTIRRVFLLARIMLLPVTRTPILFVPSAASGILSSRPVLLTAGGKEHSFLLSINTCVPPHALALVPNGQ